MLNSTIEGYRLSPQQKRLWVLQNNSHQRAYQAQCSVLIEGALDAQRFELALGRLIERHEILRTTFHCLPGMTIPVQVIGGGKDLAGEAPLQVSLTPLSPEEHVLQIDIPALYADYKSVGLLVRELADCYQSCSDAACLSDSPVQYADVSEVLNELLESEDTLSGRQYWRDRDFSALAGLRLPFQRDRVEGEKFQEKSITVEIPPEIDRRLRALADKHEVSLSALLLSGWQILLWKITSVSQMTVGVDTDCRPFQEMEAAIGLFAKCLPVACHLDEDLSLGEILRQVESAYREAEDWQEYFSWDYINGAAVQFFPFCFEFGRYPAQESAGGVTFRVQKLSSCIDRFCVKLRCAESSDLLEAEIHYDAGAILPAHVHRLGEQFQTLLIRMADDPQIPIGAIEVLSEREREQLLLSFNETSVPLARQECIHQIIERRVAMAPDSISVVFGDQQLTYHELNIRANKLARRLQSLGVGPESFVGICLERSPEMIVAILAVLKTGGAYAPLSPALPSERLSFILQDLRATVLLTKKNLLGDLSFPGIQVVELDSEAGAIASLSGENPCCVVDPQGLAYAIYTSGTTGTPKGVLIERHSVVNLAKWQGEYFGVTGQSRIAQFFSYSFDGAVGETCMALMNGATLIMLDPEDLDPKRFVETINRQLINVVVCVPSMLKQLEPDSLKHPEALTVVSVGEVCPTELALKWERKLKFINGYGPTEYTVYSHAWKANPEIIGEYNRVPIGYPIHNTQTFILDRCWNPAPIGVVGELYIGGEGIARGYLNLPATTGESFIPNGFLPTARVVDQGELRVETALAEISAFEDSAKSNGVAPRRLSLGRLTPAEVLKLIREIDTDLVEFTHRFLGRYGRDPFIYGGFCRYLLEGATDSYAACGINKEVMSVLLGFDDFKGLRGAEFGFGSGEILQILSAAGAVMKGFDLSPFFVQRARRNGHDVQIAKVDMAPELFVEEHRDSVGFYDFAISTMTLDRVENPRNLLKNLFALLRPGGSFAIQTILPILPFDDGEVEDPISYTPESHRLTSGVNEEEDKRALVMRLSDLGAGEIRICQLPYLIASSDGLQRYRVWSFSGRKREASSASEAGRYLRLYKTGDLARYLPDGSIDYVGRSDRQVKLRGFRIELGEIETTLRRHPLVKDSVVIARENERHEKRLIAYLIAEEEGRPTVNDLRKFLENRLPDYMTPAAFLFVDAWPLTSSGKVNHRELPAPEETRPELEREFAPPTGPLEKLLAEIWAHYLQVDRVGANDNFFELGGDSILAIQVVARANQEGLGLAPRDLFQHQTVAKLALAADSRAERRTAQGTVSGAAALTPIQRWFFERNLANVDHFNQAVMLIVDEKLDARFLSEAARHMVSHHDALRLRSVRSEHGWRHFYSEDSGVVPLQTEDLSKLEDAEQSLIIETKATEAQASLNLADGPIMKMVLFELGRNRQRRLLIVIHHLAVDIVSWGILLDDLYTAYRQLSEGADVVLPSKTTPYNEWAKRLEVYAQSPALQREQSYWLTAERRQVRPMPVDHTVGANIKSSCRTLTVRLESAETQALLREVPKTARMQIHEILLAALALAYAEWTGESSLLVDVEGHGREELFDDVDLSRTVGWFTAIYPLLLRVSAPDDIGTVLKAVKEQIRTVPNGGIGFGLLRYLNGGEVGRSAKSLPQSEVLFNYMGQLDRILPGVSTFQMAHESTGPAQWPQGERSHLLEVNGGVLEGSLFMNWTYSENMHLPSTIDSLAHDFIEALKTIIVYSQSLAGNIYTPSDFPHARLTQQGLENVLTKVKFDN